MVEVLESKELYSKFLPENTLFFYQPEVLNAVYQDDWRAYIGIKNAKPIWLWPCKMNNYFGIYKIDHSNKVFTNAPIVLTDELIDLDLDSIFSLGYTFIKDWHNTLEPYHLNERGWVKSYASRQYIDLSRYPEDLSKMPKNKRKKIKKARKERTLRVKRACDLEDYYNIYLSTSKRGKFRISQKEKLEYFYNRLKNYGFDINILVIYSDHTPLSAVGYVGYKNVAYSMFCAKNYKLNASGAQEVAMWEAFQLAKKTYHTFDLGGSNIEGVKNFNLEMGAESIDYSMYYLYKPKVATGLIEFYKYMKNRM